MQQKLVEEFLRFGGLKKKKKEFSNKEFGYKLMQI